jgi:N-sulfoglucosamine sulfohydrolase
MSLLETVLLPLLLSPGAPAGGERPVRPNILWISCEDMSPDLGCYGDRYAVSPAIDRLAAQGVRFTRVFSHAGVCAPARSGLITGMYPTSIGTHHMRCQGVPPPHIKCFTEYLRAAGYYCTNNVKTDYQFAPPRTAWDENSNTADWRGRAPGQPFFAVINLTTTHESRIRQGDEAFARLRRGLAPEEVHDPAKAVLPPYYPNTPVVRRDWANYHDIITAMDKEVAAILARLEEDGLAEETIVWFWSDHGRGLPRGKRWLYDSGIHVPLIIRVPEKLRAIARPDAPEVLRPGSVNEELVAFVDFAPAVLSLAGIELPRHLQGRAFLGAARGEPRRYVFAARDRMDETYDLIRAVRDERYKYIRNYLPQLTPAQDIDYMNQMPSMREMRRLHAEGKLTGPQGLFFAERKPLEELYDTLADPHEVNDLAGDPAHRETLERLRAAHRLWMEETGDVGLIPEPELDELQRPGGEWQITEIPGAEIDPGKDGELTLSLHCRTPGASIAYSFERGDKARWSLYGGPLVASRGASMRLRASRLGFRESEERRIEVEPGRIGVEEAKPEAAPHWRERLDRTDLLSRLRALKELDHAGAEALPRLIAALEDDAAPIRYWAVLGIHDLSRTGAGGELTAALARLLRDPSPAVRVAAAHALADLGEEEKSLPVLAQAMGHASGSVRLHAATALGKIGEKARPLAVLLEKALEDPFEYVARVTSYTLRRLGR